MPTKEQLKKLDELTKYLSDMKKVLVAYSGGVDSTFLLKVAKDTLGENVAAVTADMYSVPRIEIEETYAFCNNEKITQFVCKIDELEVAGFSQNPKNKCYICKKNIFKNFLRVAEKNNFTYIAEGSNLDDLGDYRPGLMALSELGIKSPLKDCGFSKTDIRELSKYLGLSTWDKPSYACLSSRFVYGETITKDKLQMVEKGENFLHELGFTQVRVRMHGMMARIEVMPEQFDIMLREDLRGKIVNTFKKYGFSYVSVDLSGYRAGSMNETL